MAVTSYNPHPWDLKLDGVGLMLDPTRDPQGNPSDRIVDGQYAPTDGGEQVSDVPVTWSDWSLGIGLPRLQSGRGGYSYALNAYTRRRDRVMAAPKKTEATLPASLASGVRIVDIKEYGGDLYLLTSGTQVLRAVDGDPANIVVARTSAISGFAGRSLVPFRGDLLVGGGGGLEVLRSGSWSPYSVPVGYLGTVTWFFKNQPATWLLGVLPGTNEFIRTDSDPTVFTDLGNPGNWSAITAVGDSSYPITNLAISNRVAMFMKTNGLHSVDSFGYSPNITKHWEDLADPTNGVVCVVDAQKSQVYATLAGTLERIAVKAGQVVDNADFVHPGYEVEPTGPIFGQITAGCLERGWIAGAIDNGTDAFLVFGKDPADLRIDAQVAFIWHGAEAWWEGQYVTRLKPSTVGGVPRLWAATYDRAAGRARLWTIGRYLAADPYQAYKQGETLEFEPSWSVTHLPDSFGRPSAHKVPLRGTVTSENLASDRILQIYARMDLQRPVELDDAGDDQYTLIPPYDGTYTLTLGDYGTTAALGGFGLGDDAATQDDIKDALEAINADLVGKITVAGSDTPFVITIPHGHTLEVSRGSLDWWIQGAASSSTRQSFLPSTSIEKGFNTEVRVDGINPTFTPAIMTSVELRQSVLEDQIETKTYVARFGPKTENRAGTLDTRDPVAVRNQIIALQAEGPIEINDEDGSFAIGKVQPGISYRKRKSKMHDGWEHSVKLRVSILKRPFDWDQGAIWDDSFLWG